MKKKMLTVLLSVTMALSLTACGSGKTAETTKAAETTVQATEAPTVAVVETAAPTADAEYEKEITMTGFGFKTLDPGDSWNAGYEAYERLVFDTLMYIDDATGEWEMQLAEAVEWADEECTKIHVVLKDDVVFSNGDPVTSEDCEFSLSRNTYGSMTSSYDSCEIVSDKEFYINLKSSNSAFMALLSSATGSIVCKAEAEAHPDGLALIGSGPYTYDMDTYVAASSITLVRNDLFWGEQNPTEKIHIVNLSDTSAAAVALQKGEIDFMINVNEADIATIEAAENVDIQKYNSYNFIYMGFNDNRDSSTLTEEDKNFRRAVACAINKEDIIAGLGGGSVMTSMWKYDADWYIANESDYEHDLSYNPEKAKEYLAKAGGKTEFTCLVSTDRAWCKLAAQVIQEYLRQVGITMNIEETDQTGFSAATKWDICEAEAQIYSNLFVSEVVNWNYYTPNNNVNRVLMNDPEINDALVKLKATSDEAEKATLYDTMQREVHDNVSWLPLVFRQMNFAYTKGLEGFSVTPSPTYQIRNICLRTN